MQWLIKQVYVTREIDTSNNFSITLQFTLIADIHV